MIPSVPSPRSTTTEVAAASLISRAASRIGVSGEQITSGGRISSATGRSAGLGAGSAGAPPGASSSERVTYRMPAGRASSGSATSARMR